MEENTQTPADENQIDQRYNLVVAFLMVVILATLSVLWMRERSRRITFEAQASQLTQENTRLRATVQQLILTRPPVSQPPTDHGQ